MKLFPYVACAIPAPLVSPYRPNNHWFQITTEENHPFVRHRPRTPGKPIQTTRQSPMFGGIGRHHSILTMGAGWEERWSRRFRRGSSLWTATIREMRGALKPPRVSLEKSDV